MALSVRQALAGPHHDSEAWVGRPVVDKVAQIFRGHLNARNRQVAKEQGPLTEYDDALEHAGGEVAWEDLLGLPEEHW